MYSIYHFWKHLVGNKSLFSGISGLSEFPFDDGMISCRNDGLFPDLAIKLNRDRSLFTGGELIELKDSKTNRVSSFNSTVPSGKKNIKKIVTSANSTIYQQMLEAGDDVFSLEERDVYYLVRGRTRGHQKICLVHGNFFETITAEDLISKSFAQILNEQLVETAISQEIKDTLGTMFSQQANFSRVRHVDKASVNLRFRIMTEVNKEGNILNSKIYENIGSDTLNLVVPFHQEQERIDAISKAQIVMGPLEVEGIRVVDIKHPFNGWFVVFQVSL